MTGVLISFWRKNGKIIAKNVGTAFAVTNRLVITCSHNVFAHVLGNHATDVHFYPGLATDDDLNMNPAVYVGKPAFSENKFKHIRFEMSPVK